MTRARRVRPRNGFRTLSRKYPQLAESYGTRVSTNISSVALELLRGHASSVACPLARIVHVQRPHATSVLRDLRQRPDLANSARTTYSPGCAGNSVAEDHRRLYQVLDQVLPSRQAVLGEREVEALRILEEAVAARPTVRASSACQAALSARRCGRAPCGARSRLGSSSNWVASQAPVCRRCSAVSAPA